jgi:hypothetical protein
MRVPSTHRSPVLNPGGYVDTATRPASEGGAQSLRGTGQDHRSSTRSVVCPLTHLPPGAGVISAGPNKLPNHSSGEGEGDRGGAPSVLTDTRATPYGTVVVHYLGSTAQCSALTVRPKQSEAKVTMDKR